MTHPSKATRLQKRRRAYNRGRWAEGMAALLLRAKGYRILARDYRRPVGEVDIIARKGRLIVAIEVKARDTSADALVAVSPRQRRRIARALEAFMQERREFSDFDVRFDVLLVTSRWRLPQHIEAAFE